MINFQVYIIIPTQLKITCIFYCVLILKYFLYLIILITNFIYPYKNNYKLNFSLFILFNADSQITQNF